VLPVVQSSACLRGGRTDDVLRCVRYGRVLRHDGRHRELNLRLPVRPVVAALDEDVETTKPARAARRKVSVVDVLERSQAFGAGASAEARLTRTWLAEPRSRY